MCSVGEISKVSTTGHGLGNEREQSIVAFRACPLSRFQGPLSQLTPRCDILRRGLTAGPLPGSDPTGR